MILSDTQIAGDLKITDGKAIYVSGEVTVPELAILESDTIVANKPVVFSMRDSKIGTIKTTDTTVLNGVITPDTTKATAVVTETRLNIATGSGALSIGGVIKTENANQSLVTVCQKKDTATPTWNAGDKILISGDTCYIYSKTQKLSEYDLSTNQFVFLPSTSFITPTRAADGLKFRLITDPTFSLA